MQRAKNATARILFPCFLICLGGLIVAAALAVGEETDRAEAPVTQWQHMALTHVLDQGYGDLGHQINKVGREGWELVSVASISDQGTTTKTVYYFKRPL